jgi:hypothetical protein
MPHGKPFGNGLDVARVIHCAERLVQLGTAADALQRALRSRFQARLSASVDQAAPLRSTP